MCKRNQKLKEHSLSLKNSLVVNECDHSERGPLFWPIAWILNKEHWISFQNAFLVDFSTTNAHLFEGMLCYKVLHSVPTNSSRLVNQGAILPSSASRSSNERQYLSCSGRYRVWLCKNLIFESNSHRSWPQNQFQKQNPHLNQAKKTSIAPCWWLGDQFQVSPPWKTSLMAVRFRSTLTKLHRTVLKTAAPPGSQLTTYGSNVEGFWFCSISNSPDIYRCWTKTIGGKSP